MGWREKEVAKLSNKRVLVVGAGGIGCELLKNIVLTGFNKIHVIDLDTIDVSNLNRQFLFRREHVGKSKAEVATEVVKNLLPGVDITFDHASIFSEKFNLPFFEQFTLVMNALDNRAARNHVNRMCLAGRIPLIESGSSGYLGQVSVIVRDRTECYECVAKPAQQKTFPGCTIRNTPSEHIHCTVWAKHLFNQLFGELDIDDDVSPDVNDEDNKAEENWENTDGEGSLMNGTSGKTVTEESVIKDNKVPENTRMWAEKVNYSADMLFNKLFNDDIIYLLRMSNLWKERRAPCPIKKEDIEGQGSSSNEKIFDIDDVNKVWSTAECLKVFSECVAALHARKTALTDGSILVWDKDDIDAMRFVAACANIRANIFGIPAKSLFEIKSMAGNIIPAIATTNAVVAGMMVIEALKVISGDMGKLRTVFITRNPNPRGKILVEQIPDKPNPKCFVCSEKRECCVRINPGEMTVKGLQDKVLKGVLHMVAPDVMDSATSRIIISSEEGETEDLEEKKLLELGIGNGSMLDCDDFLQKLQLKIIIQSSDKLRGEAFEIMRDTDEQNADVDEGVGESRKRKSMATTETLDAESENAVKRTRTHETSL